ncbi:MAG: CoA ester lyase [Casimicrobiaceae bacterium]
MSITAPATPASAPTARITRSYLFVPGGRPDRFDKALAASAHCVIIDLEDAVPAEGKTAARAAIAAWLSPERPVAIRINGATTPWFNDDLALCASPGVCAVVLPKAERAGEVERVRAACGDGVAVLPLIETAKGLWSALEVARARGVERLLLGSLDYQLDLGITDEDLLHCRSQLVLISRVAGCQPPVDGVTTAFDSPEPLARDLTRARRLGFGGKLCIHPRQVAAVNTAFQPSADEIAWARRVVEADARAGGNAVAVDGGMVDRPVLLKARAILEEAGGT